MGNFLLIEKELYEKNQAKIISFSSSIFGLLSSNKSMAKANCTEIQENNVKYVNATLNKINREEYNKSKRRNALDNLL